MPLWSEPFALWPALVLVETDRLGVVVINLTLGCRHD